MIDRIRTGILISIITVAVWIFAEQESLTEAREVARISFEVPEAMRDELALVRPDDFTGEVEVELRGAQASVQTARARLSELQKISPEQAGLATREDGKATIKMADVIANLPGVTSSGVEVVSTRPATVTLEVIKLERLRLPVVADVGELELQAPPAVSPDAIDVTMPARLATDADQFHITAVVDPSELQDLPPGEQVQRQARQLLLPEALRGVRGVRPIGVQRATVSFIVRQTNDSTPVPNAVIEISLPPSAYDAWALELPPASAVVSVTAKGPQEAIQRIRSGATPVIGVVDAVLGDLREGTMPLAVEWFIRVDGRLRPLPAGVVIEDAPQEVTVTVRPRQAEAQ
ncbi:MAG: hypothetical protein KDA20_00150 [Phycisphaerales bacterium]|nr:hypothetical protein [Phycisphaerales bacterium]